MLNRVVRCKEAKRHCDRGLPCSSCRAGDHICERTDGLMIAKFPGVRSGQNKNLVKSTPQRETIDNNTSLAQQEPYHVPTPPKITESPSIPSPTPALAKKTDDCNVTKEITKKSDRVEVKKKRKSKGPNTKQLNKQAMMSMIEIKPPGIALPKIWCEVCQHAGNSYPQAKFFLTDQTRIV